MYADKTRQDKTKKEETKRFGTGRELDGTRLALCDTLPQFNGRFKVFVGTMSELKRIVREQKHPPNIKKKLCCRLRSFVISTLTSLRTQLKNKKQNKNKINEPVGKFTCNVIY